MGMKTKVVFLDRDGVINEIRHDDRGGLLNYVNSWEDFVWLPGSKEAIVKLLEEDYFVCVVSNQAGIGKGYITEKVADHIMDSMWHDVLEALPPGMEGTALCFNYTFCPHTPEDKCSCRKPQPGLIYYAAQRWDLCLENAWMLGDQLSDLKAGWAAGMRKLIKIGEPEDQNRIWMRNRLEGKPFPDLASAVDFMIQYDKANAEGRR
jgi:D-glycero-D-manno-heptose 1,7-bisphosphate phosphatase